jgi:hypothetical protein
MHLRCHLVPPISLGSQSGLPTLHARHPKVGEFLAAGVLDVSSEMIGDCPEDGSVFAHCSSESRTCQAAAGSVDWALSRYSWNNVDVSHRLGSRLQSSPPKPSTPVRITPRAMFSPLSERLGLTGPLPQPSGAR